LSTTPSRFLIRSHQVLSIVQLDGVEWYPSPGIVYSLMLDISMDRKLEVKTNKWRSKGMK
jgi:hypothetical protein